MKRAVEDNLRDNALVAVGWNVLRFSTIQIREKSESYCIPKITETINKLGGVDEGGVIPRRIELETDGAFQLGLFDDV